MNEWTVTRLHRAVPIALVVTCVIFAVSACSGKNTFTLYRNGALSDTLRLHVATFDAAESEDDNRANCEKARELFQLQPGVTARYWCEKGRFRRK